MNDQRDEERPLGFREVLSSIFAAGMGIQSNRNRERDFTRGSARQFVVAGVVATVLFVLTVYAVVKLILAAVAG